MNYNDKIKHLIDDIIEDMASNKEGYVKNPGVDFTRDRKLPFEMVIKLVLSMKGNTLNKELYDFFGRNPEEIVTSSAFIQQRDKLNENVFIDLFHRFNESMTDMKTFRGYKLYAVDGSDINISYDEQAETYMKPQKTKKDGELSKGYNQYHLNAVYDLLNKIYVEASITPKPTTNERAAFINILEEMKLQSKTLFIADRGYPSWNMLAHFKYKQNADYLVRVPHSSVGFITEIPMTELDITKEVKITTNQYERNNPEYTFIKTRKGTQKNRVYKENIAENTKYKQWDFGMHEALEVRIVRFKITDDTYETIYTSLPRNKFSLEDIKTLYGMRWGIETSFRELKYIIGLTNLHSKKDNFVRQEIYAKLTMYNFCERIISSVVVEQDEGRKYKYQVNYTMAMTVCLDFYRALVDTDAVYDLILKYIEAIKPGRSDKRKLKPKSFVCFTYRVAA
jgi:hypothetical protein